MQPGTWYAKDGCVYVENPDGTHEVLRTSWDAERRAAEAQERRARAEAIQKNIAVKREREPEDRPGRGR